MNRAMGSDIAMVKGAYYRFGAIHPRFFMCPDITIILLFITMLTHSYHGYTDTGAL